MDRRGFVGGLGAAFAAGACATRLTPEAAELAGTWDGVAAGSNRDFQVILRVGQGATGVEIDRPEYAFKQDATIKRDGSRVTITAVQTFPRVEGRIEPDGETFVGSWNGVVTDGPRAGKTWVAPIVLKRRRRGAPDPKPPGVEQGEFVVPEDRDLRGSREIAIRYLRLKASRPNAGHPMVVLAGGPGQALIDATLKGGLGLWRFYDRDRDVILLDQRGTGRSNHIPAGPNPSMQGMSNLREPLIAWYRRELPKMWAWWQGKGVALSGYTTRQSAADVEELRKHLGAEKLCLQGGSYGSHLGLAILKYHGGSIDRVALSGLEGLDQTVKRPAAVDAVLARLAAKIAADPQASKAYPDLVGMMRRVHAKLDAKPIKVPGPMGAMDADAFAAQRMLSQFVSSTQGLSLLPYVYRAFDEGRIDDALKALPPGAGSLPGVSAMSLAMDAASGISDARLALVREEAKTAIIGDALNFPHPHVRDVIPIDLGDEFRAPFRSDVPALFHNGDLDGRTSLEEAREVAAQFTNAHFVEMENVSHSMAEEQPMAQVAFLRGEPPEKTRITAPALKFRV